MMKLKQVLIYAAMSIIFGLGVYILINKINNRSIPTLNPRSGYSNLSSEFLNAQRAASYYREQIEKNPDKIQNYVELAQIFMQQARVTGDHHKYIKDALYVIEEALNRQPNNFEAMVTKASIQMTLHQFGEAKALIQNAIKINGFNASAYGILCDANVELGLYDDAVKACDKMLSIRPDLRSYSRASYLREIHGEKQAAIDAMLLAANTGVTGQENRAWALYNLGNMLLEQGKIDSAKFIFEGILEERPGYAYALSGLADIFSVQKNYKKTIEYLVKATQFTPEHIFIEKLADIYKAQGQKESEDEMVKKVLEAFEQHRKDGYNIDLEYARFCLDHEINLKEAFECAGLEFNRRPDNIDALEIYSWALYKNHKIDEAVSYIEKALRLKTERPTLFYHAGIILKDAGRNSEAAEYLEKVLGHNAYLNPLYTENANRTLNSLKSIASK